MSQVEIHGLRAAGTKGFGNLHLEQLAADPVVLTAPRMWYNTTDDVAKFTVLVGGSVVKRSFTSAEELATAISTLDGELRAYTDNAIAGLGSALSYVGTVTAGADEASAFDLDTLTEKTAGDLYKVTTGGWLEVGGNTFQVNAGDMVLWNASGSVDKLDNTDPTVAGTANELDVTGDTTVGYTIALSQTIRDQLSGFQTDISALQTKATNIASAAGLAADGTYVARTGTNYLDGKTSLVAELTALDAQAKISADNIGALQTEMAATQAGSGLAADGSYVGRTGTNYLDAATTLAGEALALDVALKAVSDAATSTASEVDAIEAGVGLATDGSHVARTGTNYLDAATTIVAEITALDVALKAADDRAKAAEGDLSTLATSAKGNLVAAINEIHGLLGGGVSSLVTNLNAKSYIYDSRTGTTGVDQVGTGPANSHTVNHGMGTLYVNLQIWTKRADGFWYNDILPTQVAADANSVTVSLDEGVTQDVIVVIDDKTDVAA